MQQLRDVIEELEQLCSWRSKVTTLVTSGVCFVCGAAGLFWFWTSSHWRNAIGVPWGELFEKWFTGPEPNQFYPGSFLLALQALSTGCLLLTCAVFAGMTARALHDRQRIAQRILAAFKDKDIL